MAFSRRNLLLGAAAGTVFGINLPRSSAFAAEQFANPLKIPALIEGKPSKDGKLFELGIQAGTSKFLPGLSIPTLGINGAYLGPTIKCRAGHRVTFRVKNNLTEPTTLHWHGYTCPPVMMAVRIRSSAGNGLGAVIRDQTKSVAVLVSLPFDGGDRRAGFTRSGGSLSHRR